MIAGVLTSALIFALYAAAPSFLTRLDLRIYDILLSRRTPRAPAAAPFVVDIDEKSLAAYGQWPWPRYLVADLVESLTRCQVAAIAFDVLFAEEDKSSPAEMKKYLRRDKDLNVAFDGLPDDFYDYDRMLASALDGAPAVLAVFASDNRGSRVADPLRELDALRVQERATKGAASRQDLLYAFSGAVLPLPGLRERSALGTINVVPDADGIIRRIPLVMTVGGRIFPSLALRALMTALGTKNLILGYGRHGLESVRVASYTASVAPDGTMHIPFLGPRGTYDYVSAADVMQGTVEPGFLAGRAAFVGSSSAGLLDIHPTPLDPVYPGVETHAAVFDALLTGNAITAPVETPFIQVLCIALAGVVSTLVFGFASPGVYITAAIVLVAAALDASRQFFAKGHFLSPLYVVLTVAAVGVVLIFLRLFLEEREKLRIAARLAEEKAKRARTQAELDTAAGIQKSVLPHIFPPFEGFRDLEVFASMNPAKDVGGDFYDCFAVGEDRLALVMADVSGKGVPAALFMMIARTLIKEQALAGETPGEILRAVNNLLCMDNDAAMFVTAFVAILDRKNKIFTYANAGHTAPILMRSRVASLLPMNKNFVLGGMEDIPFTTQKTEFGEGDSLLLYTDGVTEAMNGRGEFFGDDRLLALAADLSKEDRPVRETIKAVNDAVYAFADGAEQSDDITTLAVRGLGQSPPWAVAPPLGTGGLA
jgi:serine phosphatase RsbU (regulator of sigma subunit)/CHASE2 domain-containing sensor protein